MKTPLAFLCAAVGASLFLFAGCAANAWEAATPGADGIALRDFKLVGDLNKERAAFTLSAVVKVENARGGSIELISGPVALTELGAHPKWKIRAEQNRYVLTFDRSGEFPVQIKFNAAVHSQDDWNTVDFQVAPGPLQQILLQGLAADTQFQFAGAARPERMTNGFVSYLPTDGDVKLSWKEARAEAEGKLFYSAEMLSQITVSPGLMRQVGLLDFKVMQGEMNRVALVLHGAGEVTRVAGDHVLAWNVERMTNSADRRLVVQLNQAQKDQFSLQVQMQTPLGAFPQVTDAMQLKPEGATRFAGYVRIVNEGAVRLEVAQASGMSQVSPEQFPESDLTRAALHVVGSQRFAYRFSGADFALKIQADQILPELAVSEVLNYNLGENELAIDAEIELDIREAPLRELLVRVPKGYVVTPPKASGMSDYFLRDTVDGNVAELRLVYGQPVAGRQLVQLHLEHNKPLGETNWALPRVEVTTAKSTRGFIGVSADAGYRLTPGRTSALTDTPTAFFPRKVSGIQAAFRLSDPAWQATMQVERLPQTVQVDAFHLFSIGEGVAYGSSVMNYQVSGAPVSTFRIELSDEYYNVEFTGKDIRNWQKTAGGYVVQLHTPVSGSYTLLATYERPFKPQGETLAFTGARPLDAQTEQGHTLIISDYQFQVKPVDVSAGLLPLEPAEVPSEYRLFFDAPILAAYRYPARPFSLSLELSPLAQGNSLNQVVDRASLQTRISKEGQVLTDVRYFVKSRGSPNFGVKLPQGTQLWSATVNGAAVVPVIDKDANLIPLPHEANPDAVLEIQLKLAQTNDARRVTVAAPIVSAPVMLAEWKLEPDTGRRLIYQSGTLTPVGGVPDVSGFAAWAKIFSSQEAGHAWTLVISAFVLLGAALVVWRWATRGDVWKYSARHLGGVGIGAAALVLAGMMVVNLAVLAGAETGSVPREVTFLAPVQQAASALKVEVSNVADEASAFGFVSYGWPVLLALAVWVLAWRSEESLVKGMARVCGWLFVAWAALRFPNGAVAFIWVMVAFVLLHLVIPAARQLLRVPRAQPNSAAPKHGAAPAAAAMVIGLLWLHGLSADGAPVGFQPVVKTELSRAEAVSNEIRVDDKFVLGTARIRWPAVKGQTLPFLEEPAVLTHLTVPRSIRLARNGDAQELVADASGTFEIEVQYQLQVTKGAAESDFMLPIRSGLVNQMDLTVVNADVDVLTPQAVSLERSLAGSNTVAKLVLSPADNVRIAWKPRSRDVKREKPVFYAEVSQLYAPSAGVIEGAHYVSIRPAQGELGELILDVPRGMTITDVSGGVRGEGRGEKSAVSLWRFDPEARKLRVTLNPAQSKTFALLVRSQIATGPLPLEQAVGLIAVENAAGQIGLMGVATGDEVQLDSVKADAFSPINLEDFSGDVMPALQGQIPGLTLRRAFRYADTKAVASVQVSPVEPDVRVETQDTLSLGEDRTVLAVDATVNITRAGIFRLSFAMPAGFDVESITGSAVSHWTEAKLDAGRIITLHFPGKTEGKQQFNISLAGPGVKTASAWAVPQVILREADKQLGTLLIVPEQGMRLQVVSRDGVTELDPQKAGIPQKGVLAFRVLQTPVNLSLDIAQVDPWIQVTSLQHATISEAQVKVAANLQYQIENTGLKSFRVLIPTDAEGVNFNGEQVAGFAAVENSVTNGLQQWEVKLHRRVIGQYLLQVNYQVPEPAQARDALVRGVQALDVNLQRGFVTVQSDPRLQVTVENAPSALQPAEWQSIPRALQQGLQATSANFAYRLVEPSFQLPLKLERHEAAKLLEARVNSVTFDSVVADDGELLTEAKLEILPGDKRLLNLTLPPGASFWFAFVNDNGVWPWLTSDRKGYLIPLEQQSRADKPITVEVFFSCKAGKSGARALDLELLAPKFDLPLENITWRVSLNNKWQVKHWNGSLQLEDQSVSSPLTTIDLQTYLQTESSARQERTKEAEEFLTAGNNALANGDPLEARRSFQAAYGLSKNDSAFNEDARVQLHNIKLQQALVGLNVRQAASANDTSVLSGKLRGLSGKKDVNYTQQDAKEIIDRNSADDNAAYMRLAERLIQQQDAAVSSASALRANIPDEGRVLTFKRAVVVDKEADLRIGVEAASVQVASGGMRVQMLAAIFVVLAVMAGLGKMLVTRPEESRA
jgi:hypothetical protein